MNKEREERTNSEERNGNTCDRNGGKEARSERNFTGRREKKRGRERILLGEGSKRRRREERNINDNNNNTITII
jgi:hypothetical protein